MIFEKQILKGYKDMIFIRFDDTETAFYYSADDFKGLSAQPFSFTASAGHSLKGYIYSYENPTENRLIIFDHGIGGGHRAYMKEIERLCSHGYEVLAYDHTGCMESGGASANGLAQSLCDLNDCLSAVKADPRFDGYDLSVVGHSWGAFSTLNISALHPEISHIVAMCGFVSVEEMIKTFFSGALKGYRRAVFALEKEANPRFAELDAVNSLSDSSVKALLIYSEDDPLCKKVHYDILKNGLGGKENIEFLLVNGKGHNPNYTSDAVGYLGEFVSQRTKLCRKKCLTDEEKRAFVASFDWERMTAQDDGVWQRIFEHLDK